MSNPIILPPPPMILARVSKAEHDTLEHQLRARDLEVARVVLERAAQEVALHVWHSQECENAINAIRALEVRHHE